MESRDWNMMCYRRTILWVSKIIGESHSNDSPVCCCDVEEAACNSARTEDGDCRE